MEGEVGKNLQATEEITAKYLTQTIKTACDKVFPKRRAALEKTISLAKKNALDATFEDIDSDVWGK